MSEFINNTSKRKAALKEIVRKLHQGRSVESLMEEFGEILQFTTASEIAEVEREMIAEGTPVEDIQKMCDLHVAVFRSGLDNEPSPESLPGHPVYDFRMDNEVIGRLLETLSELIQGVKKGDQSALLVLRKSLPNLKAVEQHYDKKENLFFPYLESHGFEGPSTVMWGVDNEVRARIKSFIALVLATPVQASAVTAEFDSLETTIRDMIYKEEKILIPEALARFSGEEWHVIRNESERVYAEKAKVEAPGELVEAAVGLGSGLITLATGVLTAEQINLLITNLPVDVTFVDENDEVRFFSQTKERVFTRTAAIIGRKVQKCHPPQSVHTVQKILDAFRAGTRDLAEFWIEMGGKFIHIRYYALRDELGAYKGTIEVSQDVTEIRALQGERRLLDD